MLIFKTLTWSCQGLIGVPQRGRRYMYVTAILSSSPSIIQIRMWFVKLQSDGLRGFILFYHRYEVCQVTCYMQSSLGVYNKPLVLSHDKCAVSLRKLIFGNN